MTPRGPVGPTSPDEFVERFKQLMAANVAGSTQLLTRLSEFVREASRTVGAEGTDAGVLLSRWLDFNLESYSVVSAQSLALLNGLISAAESTLLPGVPSPAGTSTSPRVELRLSGRYGDRATTGFAIENNFDRPVAVTFESTALVPKSGKALPASLVSFAPATIVLEPRAEGIVQATVTITPDFQVGETYTSTIHLLGFQARDVGLSVTILPPVEPAGAVRTAPRSRKPAKKRQAK